MDNDVPKFLEDVRLSNRQQKAIWKILTTLMFTKMILKQLMRLKEG